MKEPKMYHRLMIPLFALAGCSYPVSPPSPTPSEPFQTYVYPPPPADAGQMPVLILPDVDDAATLKPPTPPDPQPPPPIVIDACVPTAACRAGDQCGTVQDDCGESHACGEYGGGCTGTATCLLGGGPNGENVCTPCTRMQSADYLCGAEFSDAWQCPSPGAYHGCMAASLVMHSPSTPFEIDCCRP